MHIILNVFKTFKYFYLSKILTSRQFVSVLPNTKESKTVRNSGFHAIDSRFQVPDSGSLSEELRILDSTLLLVGFGF